MEFEKIKDQKLGEVMTEPQFNALRETVCLLILEGVLAETDDHQLGISVSEQKELLKQVFGMSEKEIHNRIEGFLYHQSNR